MIHSLIAKTRDLIGTAFAWLIIGIFGAFVVVLTLIIFPFGLLWSLLPASITGIQPMDPADVAHFDAMFEALKAGNLALLEEKAAEDPDFPHGKDRFLQRPWLINAVDAGNPASVQWVLDQGVPIDGYDDEGMSPLTSAITSEDGTAAELVSLLLKRGADINAGDCIGVTPLHVAASMGDVGVVQLLLDHGANPLAYDQEYVPEQPIARVKPKKHPQLHAVLSAAMQKAQPDTPTDGNGETL